VLTISAAASITVLGLVLLGTTPPDRSQPSVEAVTSGDCRGGIDRSSVADYDFGFILPSRLPEGYTVRCIKLEIPRTMVLFFYHDRRVADPSRFDQDVWQGVLQVHVERLSSPDLGKAIVNDLFSNLRPEHGAQMVAIQGDPGVVYASCESCGRIFHETYPENTTVEVGSYPVPGKLTISRDQILYIIVADIPVDELLAIGRSMS